MSVLRRAGLAAAVIGSALAIAAGVAGVVLPGTGGPADAGDVRGRRAAAQEVAAVTSGDAASTASALQARLSTLPQDWTSWAALGVAYVGLARTTADPAYYVKADGAFARSLRVRPAGNSLALAGQASLAASRHDFGAARRLAETALTANPYDTTALGVLTDALVELGDHRGAEGVLQRMLDLRPGVPALARVSYLRELHGDLDGARQALEDALAVSAGPGETAFARQYLGELAFNQGLLDEASRHVDEGLRADPSHAPLLAGRARVLAARGETGAALATWADVVVRLPEPSYLAEYGDLLASVGRSGDARAQYALVGATQRLFAAQGADVDLESALFDADHGRATEALSAASRERARRAGVHVEDALAWALHRAGRDEEALGHARAAQRLGTRSALFAFHRGMIEAALGRRADATASLRTALATNPWFNPLQAAEARATLRRLAGANGSAS